MTAYRYVTFLVRDEEGDGPEEWRERVGNGEAEITNDEAADLSTEEIAELAAIRQYAEAALAAMQKAAER